MSPADADADVAAANRPRNNIRPNFRSPNVILIKPFLLNRILCRGCFSEIVFEWHGTHVSRACLRPWGRHSSVLLGAAPLADLNYQTFLLWLWRHPSEEPSVYFGCRCACGSPSKQCFLLLPVGCCTPPPSLSLSSWHLLNMPYWHSALLLRISLWSW